MPLEYFKRNQRPAVLEHVISSGLADKRLCIYSWDYFSKYMKLYYLFTVFLLSQRSKQYVKPDFPETY